MAENLNMSKIKLVWDASVKNQSVVGRSASPVDVLMLNCKGGRKKSCFMPRTVKLNPCLTKFMTLIN